MPASTPSSSPSRPRSVPRSQGRISAIARCSRCPNQPIGTTSSRASAATSMPGRPKARAASTDEATASATVPARNHWSGCAVRANGSSSQTMSGGLISSTSR